LIIVLEIYLIIHVQATIIDRLFSGSSQASSTGPSHCRRNSDCGWSRPVVQPERANITGGRTSRGGGRVGQGRADRGRRGVRPPARQVPSMRFWLHEAAEAELDAAVAYYESCRPGLGIETTPKRSTPPSRWPAARIVPIAQTSARRNIRSRLTVPGRAAPKCLCP
jgi:hypothetical protein